MRSFDIFLMGLKNLFRRKTRTILTVLGVVIGTAAIVVMVSLGLGMNENFEAQLKQMGNLNIINVTKYRSSPDTLGGPPKEIVLDDVAIATIGKIKGIRGITPVVEGSMKLVSGKYMAFVQVMGIDIKSMPNFDYPIDQGRLLQEGDTDKIVVGGNIPQYFYNPKSRYGMVNGKPPVDVMTDKIEATFDMNYGEKQSLQGAGGSDTSDKPPKLYKLKPVGILTVTNDWQKDGYIFMDYLNLQKLIKDASKSQSGQSGQSQAGMMFGNPNSTGKGFERLMVMVDDMKDVDRIQAEIDDMGYGTNSLADLRKPMQKQAQTIQLVLGGIGAISLLISALGITNTMIMSIYERTREIGVMKVLGCKMGNIRQLFLLEAGIIGLFGGCLGVILSYLASLALNTVGKNVMNSGGGGMMGMGMGIGMGMGGGAESRISVIPPWLALLSIVFAIFIGLISGFTPARRAMRLSALEAIKTE